jgi:hypothetical protein
VSAAPLLDQHGAAIRAVNAQAKAMGENLVLKLGAF